MKKILLPLLLLIAGAAIGGGSAFAVMQLLGTRAPGAAQAAAPEPTSFVAAQGVLAPLVLQDGRLSGYVSFDVQLEVPVDKAEAVTAQLPLLLHAINMRTYRTPLAAGRDGMLPSIGGVRALVAAAALEAFGKNMVRRVAITRAEPA